MPVSELEKKAEIIMSTMSVNPRVLRGIVSKKRLP